MLGINPMVQLKCYNSAYVTQHFALESAKAVMGGVRMDTFVIEKQDLLCVKTLKVRPPPRVEQQQRHQHSSRGYGGTCSTKQHHLLGT